jgi:hypothetical protein
MIGERKKGRRKGNLVSRIIDIEGAIELILWFFIDFDV